MLISLASLPPVALAQVNGSDEVSLGAQLMNIALQEQQLLADQHGSLAYAAYPGACCQFWLPCACTKFHASRFCSQSLKYHLYNCRRVLESLIAYIPRMLVS